MHHGAHVDKHCVVEVGDRHCDDAFLNDDSVAKDHGVEDTFEAFEHSRLELGLDALAVCEVALDN